VSASRPTIFQQVLLISFNTLAAPKALQAENPQLIGQDHEVSARPVGAGLGACRDRAAWGPPGHEPSGELAADSAPPETPPEKRACRIGVGSPYLLDTHDADEGPRNRPPSLHLMALSPSSPHLAASRAHVTDLGGNGGV